MDRENIAKTLRRYGIDSFSVYKIIDSSKNNDYRLNIIIDNKYVLRISSNEITEKRLAEIDRLAERYRRINVLAPRLFKNDSDKYVLPLDSHIAYVSEYLDYETCEHMDKHIFAKTIMPDILKMIGRFSREFSGIDLSETMSMWSIFELAPLDEKIDEKQENLDILVDFLSEQELPELAAAIVAANKESRNMLKKIYKNLPRTVIQGDLNSSNILIKDGKFVGLIDFNMAGTEVNVNNFCAETNGFPDFTDIKEENIEKVISCWLNEQQQNLAIILSEYTLNETEEIALPLYRNLCLLSQYPNVLIYISLFKRDKTLGEKVLCNILDIIKRKPPICVR